MRSLREITSYCAAIAFAVSMATAPEVTLSHSIYAALSRERQEKWGGEPKIAEFGPSFSSFLTGVAVDSHGKVFVLETEGIAEIKDDGSISEIHVPFECPTCNDDDGLLFWSNGIAVGPGKTIWAKIGTTIVRYAGGRLIPTVPPDQANQTALKWVAFGADGQVVVSDRWDERGITIFDASGKLSRHSFPEFIRFVAVGPTTWMVGTPAGGFDPGPNWVVLFVNGSRLGDPKKLQLPNWSNVTAIAPCLGDSALFIATDAASPAQTRRLPGAVFEVRRNGDVRQVANNLGTVRDLAAGRDGVWLTQPDRRRVSLLGSTGLIRDFSTGAAAPTNIATAPDGSAWFTDAKFPAVGHVSRDGHVRFFGNGISPLNLPGTPAIAADGSAWFPETNGSHPRLAQITPDGVIREFPVGSSGHGWPVGGWIQAQGDALLYNATDETGIAKVYRRSSTGSTRTFSTSGCLVTMTNIACLANSSLKLQIQDAFKGPVFNAIVGPDRNVWFTDQSRSAIGRVNQVGQVTYFSRGMTRWDSAPEYLTVGPDGALWFTELRDRIGRVDMSGHITEYDAGLPPRSFPGGIVTGCDGALWFTLYHGNELVRRTLDGTITRFRNGITPSHGGTDAYTPPAGETLDSVGRIWFNEPQGGRIGRATLSCSRRASSHI